jgi:general stress protein CsbA
MLLAADYPFLNILWTMIIFFCWVAWIWMLVLILTDLFRSDHSGWSKAGWCLFLIILPFLGALIYLIVHGSDMAQRREHDMRAAQTQLDDRIRTVAGDGGGGGGAASQIAQAKSLLDSGAITQEEFTALKAKTLA